MMGLVEVLRQAIRPPTRAELKRAALVSALATLVALMPVLSLAPSIVIMTAP